MKKIMMFVMAVAAVMTIGTLTSCGGGDDNNEGGDEPNYVSANIYNSILTTDYCLDAFDLTVSYKGTNGTTKEYTFNKDKATVLTKDDAIGMGVNVASWYTKMTEEGKKLYICNANEELKVPANVTYSLSTKLTFKGENAKTHTSSTGKEAIWGDVYTYNYVLAKASKGKFTLQGVRDMGTSLPTSIDRGEDLASKLSKTYNFSVVLTTTEFTPKSLNSAAAE